MIWDFLQATAMVSAAKLKNIYISKKNFNFIATLFCNFRGIVKHTYRQEDENFSKSRPFFFSFDFPYKL